MNVLDEAHNLTSGDRRDDYGDVSISYQKIAIGWGVIFADGHITPEKLPLAMIWFKICRELNRHKRDSIVDMAGYARTLEMYYEEIEKQNSLSSDDASDVA